LELLMEEDLLLEGKKEGQIYFKGGTKILPRWSQLIGEIGSESQGVTALLLTKAATVARGELCLVIIFSVFAQSRFFQV
jgi:hypothetical protein